MKYKKMLEDAKQKGLTSADKMWESIASVEKFIDSIEDEDLKCKFMRSQHEIIYGNHYDEEFAKQDIEKLHYTDHDGIECHGAHWSVSQVEIATKGYVFAPSVTLYDKWVALNAMYADLNKVLTDEDVIKSALAFYFDDEDWPEKNCKVWQYMGAKHWYSSKK